MKTIKFTEVSTMKESLKNAEKQAKIWLVENNRKKSIVTYDWLKEKLKGKYCIREFVLNDDILKKLDIIEYAKNKDGFCFDDSNGTIYIFIRKDKIKESGLFTLFHELGHILLGHINNENRVIGESSSENVQANYFASLAIYYSQFKPKYKFITLFLALLIVSLSLIIISFVYHNSQNIIQSDYSAIVDVDSQNEKTSQITEKVYYLKSNSYGVYHLFSDCRHIGTKSNVEYGTLQEAKDSKKTSLCKTCKDKLNNKN